MRRRAARKREGVVVEEVEEEEETDTKHDDEPVEYEVASGDDDEEKEEEDEGRGAAAATKKRVRGSGVVPLPEDDDDTTASSSEDDDREEEEEEDSEDEYVAYAPADVGVATERVLAHLRQHYTPPPSPPHPANATSTRDGSSEGEEQLPTSRREWRRSSAIERLCRVERRVEAPSVVGLLSQAGLLRLLVPSPEGADEAAKKETAADEPEYGDESEGESADGDSNEGERVRAMLSQQGIDVDAVGVLWLAREKELASLEDALTRQYGDGSIILARVLPWLRPRLRHLTNAANSRQRGGGRGRGKERQQQREAVQSKGEEDGLPSTLGMLLKAIERERWGLITHRIRPVDVLHELELNDMVDVETDGQLRYNKRKIVAGKTDSGNTWKWLLGVLLLLFMMVPSWLHS